MGRLQGQLRKLIKPQERGDNFRILVALLSTAGFMVVAKGAGALKEVFVAYRFGTGPTADAYALVFNLINGPINAWQQIMILALVPLLARAEDPRQAELFRRELLTATLVLGAVLTMLMGSGLWLSISQGWIDLASTVRPAALELTWPLALMMPVALGSGYLAATMMSGKRQLNSLFDGIPSLVLIFALLLLPQTDATVLIIGTVAGFAAQFAISATFQPAGQRVGLPQLGFNSSLWRGFGGAFALVVISQLVLMVSNTFLDQIMVASLGSSANAVLAYSNRLMALVLSIGSIAVARATLPIFSSAAKADAKRQEAMAFKWSLGILVAGMAGLLIAWIAAPWGVRLLFKHGSFSEQDAIQVTQTLRFCLIQTPFAYAAAILTQLAASRRRYGFLLGVSVFCLVAKFALNSTLIPLMGVAGAAFATSIRAALQFAVLIIALRTMFRGDDGRGGMSAASSTQPSVESGA